MKNLKFNFLGYLLFGVSFSLFAIQNNSKELHKEIDVNPDVIVEIQNQFGDLNISSWDKNKVIIDIIITVRI